jgi:hypothetical protein
LDDFVKLFVADRWLFQLNVRQAVFVRELGSKEQSKFRAH